MFSHEVSRLAIFLKFSLQVSVHILGNNFIIFASFSISGHSTPTVTFDRDYHRYTNTIKLMDQSLRVVTNFGETNQFLKWQGRLTKFINHNIGPHFQGNLEFLINNNLVFGGLIFLNDRFMRHYAPLYKNCRNVLVDGAIRFYPWTNNADQIVTVYAQLNNIPIPNVCAVLNQSTTNAYIRFWYDENTKMELLLLHPLLHIFQIQTIQYPIQYHCNQVVGNFNDNRKMDKEYPPGQIQSSEEYITEVNNFDINGYGNAEQLVHNNLLEIEDEDIDIVGLNMNKNYTRL